MIEHINIKPISYYNKVKAVFNHNRVCNRVQCRYISRPVIGCCSELYEKLAPSSIQDFADKYVESAVGNKFNRLTMVGRRDCGRSVDDLKYLAHQMFIECNQPTITEEMCFDNLVAHILIETLSGKMVEDYIKRKIEESGENAVTIEKGDIDTLYNVDMTVRSKINGKIVKYIQVKPITTFLGNNNMSLRSDRRNFFVKQINFNNYLFESGRKQDVSSIKYICYRLGDNGYEFLCKDGKTEFVLSDLANEDGTTRIENYNDCQFVTL